MFPEMTASSAAGGSRVIARAWLLDAVIDIDLHPRLVNESKNFT